MRRYSCDIFVTVTDAGDTNDDDGRRRVRCGSEWRRRDFHWMGVKATTSTEVDTLVASFVRGRSGHPWS